MENFSESTQLLGRTFNPSLYKKYEKYIPQSVKKQGYDKAFRCAALMECAMKNSRLYLGERTLQLPDDALGFLESKKHQPGSKELAELFEAGSTTAALVGFGRAILPIVSKAIPTSQIDQVVHLSPMLFPTQYIYYRTSKYGTALAAPPPAINVGDDLFDITKKNAAYTASPGELVTVRDFDTEITHTTINVQTHKSRAKWSWEYAQDLLRDHNLSALVALSTDAQIAHRRSFEMKIVEEMFSSATTTGTASIPWTDAGWAAGPVNWEQQNAYLEHQLSLKIGLEATAMRKTRGVRPNFIVASFNVAEAFLSLKNFSMDPGFNLQGFRSDDEGFQFLGTWKGYRIYAEPHLEDDNAILGYYSTTNPIHTGMVVGIYDPASLVNANGMAAVETDTFTDPNDFSIVKGFISRFGIKTVNASYYKHLEFSGIVIP